MTVKQLVKLYAEGAGSDDEAGEQFLRMGVKARDELIRMLDDPKTSQDDAGTLLMILCVYFRSEETIRALDRYAARSKDPKVRGLIEGMKKMIRTGGPPKR